MKHAEPDQFDASTISQAEMPAWKLAPDIFRAISSPVHILKILDRIAAKGDRVKLRAPNGKVVHFFFHPSDLGKVFATNNKKVEIPRRQIEAAKTPDGKLNETIISSSGPKWKRERQILGRHVDAKQGVHHGIFKSLAEEINEALDRWATRGEFSLGKASSDLFVRLSYRALFNQSPSDQTCENVDKAGAIIQYHQFCSALTNGVLKPFSKISPELRLALKTFNTEVAAIKRQYLDDLSRNKPPTLIDDLLHEDAEGDAEAKISMMIRASHTTMTHSLFTAIWQLAARPDLQERLSSNTDQELLDQVIKETLRFSPAIPTLPRDVLKGFSLEDGYEINVGDTVSLAPYITNKDPRFYAAPFSFDPELHFSKEAVSCRPENALITYGMGPRKCPGRALAEQQLGEIIKQMCSRFEFSRVTQAEPKPNATFIMLTDPTTRIALRPRGA